MLQGMGGDMQTRRVLFLCTGNFYRSRLAEILFEREGLPGWSASSRGLVVSGALKGLAPQVAEYLASEGVVADLRDPAPLLVDELVGAEHVVLLNASEHEPLLLRDFRAVYRKLLADGAVTKWNVFDLPARKVAWGQEPPPGQPPVSAIEHIRFAVSDLVRRLGQREGKPAGS